LKPSFLIFDKPADVTSHDIVAMIRAVTGMKKVGHTGTLDPFATGVLPLAIGPATKLISYLDESLKVYDALIRFGTVTDTGDPTGTVVRKGGLPTVNEGRVREVLAEFVGEQQQQPPPYSAVKYKGKPLYYYARQGLHVEVPARPITVYGMEMLEYTGETLRVMIRCSRGTYARVLAQDIAAKLGSLGHLEALSRPQSGPFKMEQALNVETLCDIVSAEPGRSWQDVLLSRNKNAERVKWNHRNDVVAALQPYLVSPIQVLNHMGMVDVNDIEAKRILNGGRLPLHPSKTDQNAGFLVVHQEKLLALGQRTEKGIKSIRLMGNG
jgi:tRNA pseudouridine55 synthase